ncbi:acetyltransferase [Oceanobacillus massiliensis]|uniref:acetyltransferase n=1 Tax=Oceanobacillus massiliensis TaxID=1465765 RepID=UPI0002882282|nr:acetyltransferase [Oceanobacillus massiliensis]
MEDIILLGGGGHAKSIIDSLKSNAEYKIIGILDMKNKIGKIVNGVEVIGQDSDLAYFYEQGIKHAFVTVGALGDNSIRIKLFRLAKSIGYNFPAIIDKTAIVSETAQIREGTFIGKGAIINTNVTVGENCIINTGVIIDHDCFINSSVHLAPGTTLSGEVHIGNGSHLGTNSTVIQDITIGSNTIIGAGSVVVKNIESNKKAYGNPCRVV